MLPCDVERTDIEAGPVQPFRTRFCKQVGSAFERLSNKYPELPYSKKFGPSDTRVLEELGLPHEGFLNATALVGSHVFLMVAETAGGEVVFRAKLGELIETTTTEGIEHPENFSKWNRVLGKIIRSFEKFVGLESGMLYNELVHNLEYCEVVSKHLASINFGSLAIVHRNEMPNPSAMRSIIIDEPGQPDMARIIQLKTSEL